MDYEIVPITERAVSACRRHYTMPRDLIKQELQSFYKFINDSGAISINNVHLEKIRRGWMLKAEESYKVVCSEL